MADTYQLLIGGEHVDGARGTYDIVNPATEQVVGQAPEASAEQATQARYCTAGAGGSLTSLAPTPRQYSLTLRRTWRF